MNPILNIAIRAARKAGNIIAQGYERHADIQVNQKAANDYVTNIDKMAEKAVIDTIHKSYTEHSIIAEESGLLLGRDDDIQWIIDPLDGTTNFVKAFPHFAVSIAVRIKNRTEIAVVYDPINNELFTAVRGEGAKLNDFRLRIDNKIGLSGSILGTGFPFKTPKYLPTQLNIMQSLIQDCADFRCSGAAALDLCYLAAGRLEGYFEINLKPWDIAAGDLVVREAGGITCDLSGGHQYLKSGHIIAGSAKIVKDMLVKIQPHLSDDLK